MATFRLAINSIHKKNDDGSYGADFVQLVAYGKRAESLAQNMKKGRLLGVTTRCATSDYMGKDNKRVYKTEFVIEGQFYVDWGGNKKGQASEQNSQQDYNFGNSDITPIDDGDMPF